MSNIDVTKDEFPPEYRPYDQIILCTNTFTNVKYILEIDGHHPLLIGKSDIPEVWIMAPVDNTRERWGFVVNKNVALHPDVHVTTNRGGLTVKAGPTLVLTIGDYDAASVMVTQLDFRPFGMKIVGDSAGLRVGSNILKGNKMSGLNVGIAIS
jgi:hypothetical protein